MRLTPGPGGPVPQDRLGGIDLLDPDLYTDGDPHRVWDALRVLAPLHHQTTGDGGEFWSVTRYDDCCAVLGDHQRFTSERGTVITHVGEDDIAAGQLMTSTDPPRHTEVRRAINGRLTARALAGSQGRIRRAIVEFLGPALDGATFDIAEAAQILPMMVAGPLLGIPDQDWDQLVRLSAMVTAPTDPHFRCGGRAATLAIAHHEIIEYVSDWVRRRRAVDVADGSLLDTLLAARPGGRPLTDHEIAYDGYSIVLGANVTTPHTVSGTVAALIEQPDQLLRVRADPHLVPGLVEEALRWTSAACNFMRYAVDDVDLAGGTVPAGGAVVAWIGAGNRDPARFTDPHTFDVERHPNRHIAFGFGPHYCIGAPLARLTLQIFFEELTSRFDSLELRGAPTHLRSYFIAGLTHLPIAAGKK